MDPTPEQIKKLLADAAVQKQQNNLRAQAQMSELLKQIFVGVGDSVLGGVGAFLTPLFGIAESFIDSQLDEFTGIPLSSIPVERMSDRAMLYNMRQSFIGNKRSVSKELNKEFSAGLARAVYANLFTEDTPENNAAREFYATFDPNNNEAYNQAINTFGFKAFEFFVGMAGVTDKGVNAMVGAVARRANMLAPEDEGSNIYDTREIVGAVAKNTIRGVFDRYIAGDYGSLSFAEVGAIANGLIQRGGLDSIRQLTAPAMRQLNALRRDLQPKYDDLAAQELLDFRETYHPDRLEKETDKAYEERVAADIAKKAGEIGKKYEDLLNKEISEVSQQLTGENSAEAAMKKVTDEFTARLKGYSNAIESLRTVFDGSVPEILAKIESLSGGSIYNMPLQHVKDMATRMEHVSLTTGIDGKALETLTKTFYTQGVGKMGGNEAFARNAAMLYSYQILHGPKVYGVSQTQFERAFAGLAGISATTGKTSDIAAAYYAFLASNNAADSEKMQEEFKKITNGDYSYANMKQVFEKYAATAGITDNFEAIRHNKMLIQSLKDSPFVFELAENSPTGGLGRVKEMRDRMFGDIIKTLGIDRKEGETDEDYIKRGTEELLKQGVNLNQSTEMVKEQIRTTGAGGKGAEVRVANLYEHYGFLLGAQTGMTSQEAVAAMQSVEDGKLLRQLELEMPEKPVNLPGTGAEAMLVATVRAMKQGRSISLGELTAAYLKNVDAAGLSATEYLQQVEQMRDYGKKLIEAKDRIEGTDTSNSVPDGPDGEDRRDMLRGLSEHPEYQQPAEPDGSRAEGTSTAATTPAGKDDVPNLLRQILETLKASWYWNTSGRRR